MDEAVSERFYDEEIAPILLRLAQKCQLNNMSFVASVEWNPGKTGKTISIHKDASIEIRLVYWAAIANGNADILIKQMQKHSKEHGHNSVYLTIIDGLSHE